MGRGCEENHKLIFAIFSDLRENAFNLKKKSMWGRASISLETPGNAEPQEDVSRPQMVWAESSSRDTLSLNQTPRTKLCAHTYTLSPLHSGRLFNDHLIYRVQLRYKNKQIPPSATIWLYSADLKGQSSIGWGKGSSHQDTDNSTWSRQLRVCRRCRKSSPRPFLSSDLYHRNLLMLLIFAFSGSSQIKVKMGWFCKCYFPGILGSSCKSGLLWNEWAPPWVSLSYCLVMWSLPLTWAPAIIPSSVSPSITGHLPWILLPRILHDIISSIYHEPIMSQCSMILSVMKPSTIRLRTRYCLLLDLELLKVQVN